MSRYYIRLKDGIVCGTLETHGEILDAIEVKKNSDVYLNYKYENGSFTEIQPYIFASITNDVVVFLRESYFISEKNNDEVVATKEVEIGWTYNGSSFSAPIEETGK